MTAYHLKGRGRRVAAGLSVAALAAATALPAAAGTALAAPAHHLHPGKSIKHPAAGVHGQPSILNGKTPARGEPGGTNFAEFPTHGPVTVMLELNTLASAKAFASARIHGANAAASAGKLQSARISALAGQVASHLPALNAKPLFTLHNVYAGVAVHVDASQLHALAAIPGVKAIHPMPVKYMDNKSSVKLIQAPQAWDFNTGGNTGTGVRVGIIDTGIDYTHANFGGTGTKQAYASDHAVSDSKTLNVPTGDYPSKKVAGGWDFAGDGYDASSSDPAVATPHQDPNPLDCNGHGSHVAGTTAGMGVDANGRTYSGPYTASADFSSFKIGPGVAPQATLYGLRVFGCEGSTNLVSEALDWAADPNGDGNFNDHLDVVNMSLGSDYAVPDDPDAVASDNASLMGITVAAAAGNGGDLFDVGGSPGNAQRVIGVAASQDALNTYDAMKENTPSSQMIAGQRSVAYDWANSGPVTGDVVSIDPSFDPATGFAPSAMQASNADGCAPFTAAQAAAVKGKMAWLEWTDNDSIRRCGSAVRSGHARAAGAIGAIFSDDEDTFAAGITGDPVIPVFQIRKTDADALRPAAVNGTLNVTLSYDYRNSIEVYDNSLNDVIASFSSRGSRYAGDTKPDVTAPGATIFSTAVGTGNEGMTDSGTSMATPHIAGVVALVKQAHPGWSPEQIKAAIMNTASQAVYTDTTHTTTEAPNRVGAGRVVASDAVATEALAYNKLDSGAVGVSFGPIQVSKDTALTKLVTIENDGTASETYDIAVDDATSIDGATYSVSPSSVTVAAGSTATVSVVLTLSYATLDRTHDASLDMNAFGLTRQFVSDASGWLIATPQSGTQALRVPLYAAPRPVSSMHAANNLSFDNSSNFETAALNLTGTGLSGNGDTTYQSVVSTYEEQLTSPQMPDCTARITTNCVRFPSDRAGDIKAVGATSDSPLFAGSGQDPLQDGLTYFAVATQGPWNTPASYAEYDVMIDANGDGSPDAVLYNTRAGATDLFISELVDLNSGDILDEELINNSDGSFDTNVFDNNVITLPVMTAALYGLANRTRITYWVEAGTIESGLTDTTGKASFDIARPGLSAVDGPVINALGGEQFFQDNDGNSLTILRDAAALRYDKPLGLMVVHHQNNQGSTVETVHFQEQTSVALSCNTHASTYGHPATCTVTVRNLNGGPTPTGIVRILANGHTLRRLTLSGGSVTSTLPVMSRGSYTITAVYYGDTDNSPGTSGGWSYKIS